MSTLDMELFALTDEIINGIIFAMENQNTKFAVNFSTGIAELSNSTSLVSNQFKYIELPNWTPADGFRLMTDFVTTLQNPIVSTALTTVLNSGHGVFRRFKDTLAEFPEIERKWFTFKDDAMHRIVRNWYNSVREENGLEKIGTEPEEVDDIINSDFVFTWSPQNKNNSANRCRELLREEFAESAQKSPSTAIACTAYYQLSSNNTEQTMLLTANDESGTVVAYLLVDFYPQSSNTTACITEYFVLKEFRGLGLASALIKHCIDHCKQRNITHLGIVPPIEHGILHNLENQGLKLIGPLYIMAL